MDRLPPKPYLLLEASYRQLLDARPNLAILPWGATEAHNFHLPHGTDVIEAECVAVRSAQLAYERGARPIVLPVIPFGNNAQQLDQVATIHMSPGTAMSLLNDVCASLKRQGIGRLVIVNGHGGNDFKPFVRDAQLSHELLIVVANLYEQAPDVASEVFDDPGDHAGELETSLMMHLRPGWVAMESAGEGERVPFAIESLRMGNFWTPRPWSASHPDTGAGDPSAATPERGERFFDAVCEQIAGLIVDLSSARKGDLPYI